MTFIETTRRVVRRWPSEQTCGGDYVEDDTGQVWKIIDRAQADFVRSQTCGHVGTIWRDRIKP